MFRETDDGDDMIDRELLKKSFSGYVGKFDRSDERISLKIVHTSYVAGNSDDLSDAFGLSERDKDLAWAVAMLHDIGRFEQVAANGSFIDSVNSDHANAGVEFLFEKNGIRDFLPEETVSGEELECMRLAILWHNKHQLPDGLTERQQLFCNMIRDADKLDIFRVCVENSFEVAHEYSVEEVKRSEVSEEVLRCFERFETLDYSKRKFPADIFLGHIAMCFGLFYPQSRKLAAEQGYMERMADFSFSNEESQEKYEYMKKRLNFFLSNAG